VRGAFCSTTYDGAGPEDHTPGLGAKAGRAACIEEKAESSGNAGTEDTDMSENLYVGTGAATVGVVLQRGGTWATGWELVGGPQMEACGAMLGAGHVSSVGFAVSACGWFVGAARPNTVSTPGSSMAASTQRTTKVEGDKQA
jgi:hypothetical protein